LARSFRSSMNQKRLAEFCLDPQAMVAWETGVTLTGYSINRNRDGWLLVIRVNTKTYKKKVAFIQAPTIDACWELFYSAVTTTSFTLKWKTDKY